MTTRDNAYRAAVEAAKVELAELNAKLVEMEPIIRRKAMIEVFLQNANALAEPALDGAGNAIPVRVADSVRVSDSAGAVIVPGKGKSLSEGAREVLSDAKHPMTAPRIVKAMRGTASTWRRRFSGGRTRTISRERSSRRSREGDALPEPSGHWQGAAGREPVA